MSVGKEVGKHLQASPSLFHLFDADEVFVSFLTYLQFGDIDTLRLCKAHGGGQGIAFIVKGPGCGRAELHRHRLFLLLPHFIDQDRNSTGRAIKGDRAVIDAELARLSASSLRRPSLAGFMKRAGSSSTPISRRKGFTTTPAPAGGSQFLPVSSRTARRTSLRGFSLGRCSWCAPRRSGRPGHRAG